MTHTARFQAASISARLSAFALAAVVSFGTLGSMGLIADHQMRDAESDLLMAQADTAPLQVIVITGHLHARS